LGDHYNSKMAQKIPQAVTKAIKDYIDVIRQDMPVEKVIIYGSHARGAAKFDSDIDIAVISNRFGKNPQKEGQYLFRKLWEVEHSNIEPIGYSPEDFDTPDPSPLLYEIRKHGQEISI